MVLVIGGTAGCIGVVPKVVPPQSIDRTEKSPPAIVLLDGPGQRIAPTVDGLIDGPLTLGACIQQALSVHPDLAFVAAQTDSARGTLLQAGLYPNPTIGYGADEIGSPDGGAGFEGVILGQTFVTGNKLGLASEAAAHGVEAAEARARARYYSVVTRVRTAYYESLAARQELDATRDILRIAQSGLETAEKLKQTGVVGQPDVLRARVELEQGRIRVATAEQRSAAAWKLLTIALGRPELAPQPLAGSLVSAVPEFELPQALQVALEVSAELQAGRAAIRQAEAALARAEAEVVPDLRVEVRPVYSHPDRRAEVNVAVTSPIPVFDRNQGNILAARAGIGQAHAALRQAELALTERMTLAHQRYRTARAQVEAYEKSIIPAAQESVRLISIAYSQGDQRYDFTALLEAQRSLAQAKLGLVQGLGELQKAVGDIEGLLQKLPAEPVTPPSRGSR